MRWVTYTAAGAAPRAGLLARDRVLGAPAGTSVRGLLETGALAEAGAAVLAAPDEVHAVDAVRLLAPVPDPPALRDGLCFLQHLRNSRRVQGLPERLEPVWDVAPAFYFGNPAGLLGPRDDVPIAPGSAWFDLELEVAAVIGTGGRDLDPRTAERHIAGYTLMCDWSARDLQVGEMQQGLGPAKAKDAATTLGPALVTVDELEPHRRDGRLALGLSAAVNGVELTRGALDDADWTFGDLLAHASRGVDLRPGDVIGSGTVPGGCLVEHLDTDPASFTRWLRPGDEVSLTGEGLGATHQRVVPGTAPVPLLGRRRTAAGR